jgi:hypothetical protein
VDVLDKYNTFTGLREAYPSVESVRDLFGGASVRERLQEASPKVARWLSRLAAPHPEPPAGNGVCFGSLVRQVRPGDAGLDYLGHVIYVEGFGTLRLGEVTISSLSRSVTMLQVHLGCPVEGHVFCCSADGGCTPG